MREAGCIQVHAEMSAALCLVMLSELKLITVRSVLCVLYFVWMK